MNDVIDLLASLMQQAQSLAGELSKEEMDKVLQIFADAIEIISKQEAQTPTTPVELPEVPGGPFPSSNVNGFKFNPKTGELLIQFHGPYPKAEGPIYSYQNVPKYIFDIIARGAVGPKTSGENSYHRWIKGVTPSLGAAVNALIKAGGFPYQKIG